MRCDELINEFLMSYVEGALAPDRREAFEHHLGLCRSCRNYLDQYRRTIEAARTVRTDTGPLPPPPEELIRAILASAPTAGR